MMQPTHIAKPELVHATAIHNSHATDTGYLLSLSDGRKVEVPAVTFELCGAPLFGDYLVASDTFMYILAKTVFERRYMKLAELAPDPKPMHMPMPPAEVCKAAELVGRHFATQNIGDWELGPCRIRFPRGAGA